MSLCEPGRLQALAENFGFDISCGKIAHRTREMATAEMGRLRLRSRNEEEARRLNVYRCGSCGHFHVGKRSLRVMAGWRDCRPAAGGAT